MQPPAARSVDEPDAAGCKCGKRRQTQRKAEREHEGHQRMLLGERHLTSLRPDRRILGYASAPESASICETPRGRPARTHISQRPPAITSALASEAIG